MDFLKNVFGTGSNIFGASGNNTDSLVKNGLLQQTDVDKASNQSLFRGLLGTAVGYLAQPKNQGYGSVGCSHCTAKGAGREGRWKGKGKTECGLHLENFEEKKLAQAS